MASKCKICDDTGRMNIGLDGDNCLVDCDKCDVAKAKEKKVTPHTFEVKKQGDNYKTLQCLYCNHIEVIHAYGKIPDSECPGPAKTRPAQKKFRLPPKPVSASSPDDADVAWKAWVEACLTELAEK